MQPIVAVIHRNDRGAAVRNLQEGLLRLLAGDGSTLSAYERQVLENGLAAEQREARYGDATTRAVARFQRDHHVTFDLPVVTGEQVDAATAAAMNRMLHQLGALEPIRT